MMIRGIDDELVIKAMELIKMMITNDSELIEC